MSVFDRNEPKMTGAPGRMSCVSAMPASALGHLLHERRGDRHGRHRAHQQERRDDHGLVALHVLVQRREHAVVEAQRRVDVDERHRRRRLLDRLAARRRGSRPSRSCRPRSGRSSPSPCTACPTGSAARRPCRGGASRAACRSARRSCRPASRAAGTPATASRSCGSPPSSRRGGCPPRARTAARRPTRRPCGRRRCGPMCSGLRAWMSNSRGALATCSRMNSGSSLTLLPSTFWPALRNSSSDSSSRNSTPSSDTIRRQPRSSVSMASSLRIS